MEVDGDAPNAKAGVVEDSTETESDVNEVEGDGINAKERGDKAIPGKNTKVNAGRGDDIAKAQSKDNAAGDGTKKTGGDDDETGSDYDSDDSGDEDDSAKAEGGGKDDSKNAVPGKNTKVVYAGGGYIATAQSKDNTNVGDGRKKAAGDGDPETESDFDSEDSDDEETGDGKDDASKKAAGNENEVGSGPIDNYSTQPKVRSGKKPIDDYSTQPKVESDYASKKAVDSYSTKAKVHKNRVGRGYSARAEDSESESTEAEDNTSSEVTMTSEVRWGDFSELTCNQRFKCIAVILFIFLIWLSVNAVGAYYFFLHLSSSTINDPINTVLQRVTNLTNDLQDRIQELQQQIRGQEDFMDELSFSMEGAQEASRIMNTLEESLVMMQSTSQQARDIVDAIRRVGQSETSPILSCSSLPHYYPSGHYYIRVSNGSSVRLYCDMTRSCDGVVGQWTRVFRLNMSDSSDQCLPSWMESKKPSTKSRMCSLPAKGCTSDTINTFGIHYSYVCGKIIGLQVGEVDSFSGRTSPDIDSNYVDGISLTHGNPRQHIWTFAASHDESQFEVVNHCPCINNRKQTAPGRPPAFVGTDYFCDTGSSSSVIQAGLVFDDDPLWDGDGCDSMNVCCEFNSPPWFLKQLEQPTTNDIEIRGCMNEPISTENIAITTIEIYLR